MRIALQQGVQHAARPSVSCLHAFHARQQLTKGLTQHVAHPAAAQCTYILPNFVVLAAYCTLTHYTGMIATSV
jgi:hypothetical protein